MLAKSHAAIDFTTSKKKVVAGVENIPSISAHPDLYQTLIEWRKKTAAEKDIKAYEILHTRVILAITHYLPTDAFNLKAIKGIGKVTITTYGAELVEMIASYCQKNGVEPNQMPAPTATKPPKVNTKEVSLTLYKSGKTLSEIATTRNLTEGTISGHLGHYISKGELDIHELMDKGKVATLEQILIDNSELSFTELKVKYKDEYSYQDMRMVANYLKFKELKD